MTQPLEIERLRREILEHDRRYYLEEKPIISDSEYDALMNRLKALETQYPEAVTKDSPTQRVGGNPSKTFSRARHAVPMLSLDNTYNEEDVREWHKRILKLTPMENLGGFLVETKIDGLSCSLTYQDGKLERGATRGDGEVGEDVTANVRVIPSIPISLKNSSTPIPRRLEVRGEVVIFNADFEKINATEIAAKREPFVNARNCAAGSLRQKDPKITAERRLNFIAHSFGIWEPESPFENEIEFLKALKNLGFETPPHWPCSGIKAVLEKCRDFKDREMRTIPFAVDGLVVKVESFSRQKILGSTSKSPRWAIAFKYPASQATSDVLAVEFSIGRTGAITPVAKLKPVFCAGVTISSVTLHNFDEVARLGLKIGDTVLIERAGEVIPKIIKVVKKSPNGKDVLPPKFCPACQTPVIQEENQVATLCPNPSCPAQIRRGLLHFASREALNIQGLGESVVDQLVQSGQVKDFADLYTLKIEDILKLELFAQKRAQNLLEEIEKSKSKPLACLIYGLGLPHVGEKTARMLAERMSLLELSRAGLGKLEKISDIGPTIASSIADFFLDPLIQNLIERLNQAGLNTKQDAPRKTSATLEGLGFVFTGELLMPRSIAEEKVKSLGGKTSSSVSAKTSYLVAGDKPGSKIKKARELGVKILSEEDFNSLMKGKEPPQ